MADGSVNCLEAGVGGLFQSCGGWGTGAASLSTLMTHGGREGSSVFCSQTAAPPFPQGGLSGLVGRFGCVTEPPGAACLAHYKS